MARDVPLKIVADKGSQLSPEFTAQSLVVRKDLIDSGRFKDYPDLAGLNIGVSGHLNSVELLVDIALQRGGLTLDDAQTVVMAFPDLNAAFANRSLDAAIHLEPGLTAGLSQGLFVAWKNAYDLYPQQQVAVLLYAPAFAADRDLAQRFTTAYLRGVRDYNDAFRQQKDLDAILDILTQYTHDQGQGPLPHDPGLRPESRGLRECGGRGSRPGLVSRARRRARRRQPGSGDRRLLRGRRQSGAWPVPPLAVSAPGHRVTPVTPRSTPLRRHQPRFCRPARSDAVCLRTVQACMAPPRVPSGGPSLFGRWLDGAPRRWDDAAHRRPAYGRPAYGRAAADHRVNRPTRRQRGAGVGRVREVRHALGITATNADEIALALDQLIAMLQDLRRDLPAGDRLADVFNGAASWRRTLSV